MQSPNTFLLLQSHGPSGLLFQSLIRQFHIGIHLVQQPHVGISLLVDQISLVLEAAHARGELVDHVVLLTEGGGGGGLSPSAAGDGGGASLGGDLTLQPFHYASPSTDLRGAQAKVALQRIQLESKAVETRLDGGGLLLALFVGVKGAVRGGSTQLRGGPGEAGVVVVPGGDWVVHCLSAQCLG